MALLKGFEMGTLDSRVTQGISQGQESGLSGVRAMIYSDASAPVLGDPLAPAAGDMPSFRRPYTILIGGLDENPALVMPEVGEEFIFTATKPNAAIYNGYYRLISDARAHIGARTSRLDTVELTVIKYDPES